MNSGQSSANPTLAAKYIDVAKACPESTGNRMNEVVKTRHFSSRREEAKIAQGFTLGER